MRSCQYFAPGRPLESRVPAACAARMASVIGMSRRTARSGQLAGDWLSAGCGTSIVEHQRQAHGAKEILTKHGQSSALRRTGARAPTIQMLSAPNQCAVTLMRRQLPLRGGIRSGGSRRRRNRIGDGHIRPPAPTTISVPVPSGLKVTLAASVHISDAAGGSRDAAPFHNWPGDREVGLPAHRLIQVPARRAGWRAPCTTVVLCESPLTT